MYERPVRHEAGAVVETQLLRQIHRRDGARHELTAPYLRAPVVCTYGTNETPEFQRQNRDFVAAVRAAGKPAELVEAPNYNHFEMGESLANPYGPNGRAALTLMQLKPA